MSRTIGDRGRPGCLPWSRHPLISDHVRLRDPAGYHGRAHESLRRLIVFCGNLGDDVSLPLTGFGFLTILRQLEHTIGAEVYWQTVVIRGCTEESRLPNLPDVAAIEAFRQQTASGTRSFLEHATEAELNAPRGMISDPGPHAVAPAGGCDHARCDAHLQPPRAGTGDVPHHRANRTTNTILIIRWIERATRSSKTCWWSVLKESP